MQTTSSLFLLFAMSSGNLFFFAAGNIIEEFDGQVFAALQNDKGLEFIGKYGTKNFYLHAGAVTQNTARSRCQAQGLNLVQFDSQAELTFVSLKSRLEYCWTDAVIHSASSSFKWQRFEQSLAAELYLEAGDSVGMTIRRYWAINGILHPRRMSELHCYICYQRGY